MGFFFSFFYMVDYIDRLSYVQPFLDLWDEADLIMVGVFSDVFLDLVCQQFIVLSIFATMFIEGDWPVILFLSNVFVWFGYQGSCSLIKRIWQCSF